jgi:hypothetical protein
VPGTYVPIGGGPSGGDGSFAVGYRDPGFGPGFGRWCGRVLMILTIWLTIPLQMALYPIAGAAALVAALPVYVILRAGGIGMDAATSWGWSIAFVVILATMRIETGIDAHHPTYRARRHWFRLVAVAVVIFYALGDEAAGTPLVRVIATLVITVIAHFVLRAGMTRGFWEQLQSWAWLRKA